MTDYESLSILFEEYFGKFSPLVKELKELNKTLKNKGEVTA